MKKDVIEKRKSQLKRKKKKLNQETEWKNRMIDKEDGWNRNEKLFLNTTLALVPIVSANVVHAISAHFISCPLLHL